MLQGDQVGEGYLFTGSTAPTLDGGASWDLVITLHMLRPFDRNECWRAICLR